MTNVTDGKKAILSKQARVYVAHSEHLWANLHRNLHSPLNYTRFPARYGFPVRAQDIFIAGCHIVHFRTVLMLKCNVAVPCTVLLLHIFHNCILAAHQYVGACNVHPHHPTDLYTHICRQHVTFTHHFHFSLLLFII